MQPSKFISSTLDRIARLEQENAALKKELAEIQAQAIEMAIEWRGRESPGERKGICTIENLERLANQLREQGG